ncbi:MAG: TonB-dependent receptor plug domain-containing protein, partial [Prevotella sp.]|nr:TonB-dependent receptor plug domain-containing protein [Prevotella sp.]
MVNVHFQKKGMMRALMFALLLLNSTLMFAQSVVTGNVKDQTGEPLIGVSILEQGTSNGTVTDIDGNFSFKVAQGKTINFSYVGYQSQSVVVRGNVINVVLLEENTNLNEVVVVGYGTMRRKDVTSSITTVKAEDLNRGVFTDPASMLQGKVAGLTVTTTGDPNGGASITLRGASSLRTGAAMEPYYVIDGIPGVDISMVAPDDIESIDVLRDASATAIYGS